MLNLLAQIKKECPSFDEAKISKAFEIYGEENQICMKHAKVMLSLHPDEETFLVYILHPGVANNIFSTELVKQIFGEKIAERITHLLAILSLQVSNETNSETLRKMFLTLARDFRTVLLLLVVKLEELEHLKKSKSEQLKDVAQAAMEIYIPIATRLGIYEIKSQMEEICFAVLYPDDYLRVTSELKPFQKLSNQYIQKVTDELSGLLQSSSIPVYEISGRMKHPYSIYKKMRKKQKQNVSDIFDIFAFRIILKDTYLPTGAEDLANCYAVLGIVHSKWRPIARRFKDYIAVPKINGYRSLHTTVLGLTPTLRDEPAEIQIRTESMHHEAEFGIAAHWWYKESKKLITTSKENASDTGDPRIKNQLEWLKGLAELHQSLEDNESDSSNKSGNDLELFADQIFVLTPNGDVKDLPIGSTPIDFAYTVHTEVGNTCSQAKVNGTIVTLDHELKNGDVVQIVTKKGSSPNRYWLSFVKTHVAQYRIKNYFRMQDRENNLKTGRELLNKELTRLNQEPLDPTLTLFKNFNGRDTSFKEREFVLESLGNGHYSVKDVLKKVLPADLLIDKTSSMVEIKKEDLRKISGESILVSGETNIPVDFASCCTPQFGSPIIGYVGRGQHIKVHELHCAEVDNLEKERLIPTSWADSDGYYITLELETDDTTELATLIWEKLKMFPVIVKELSTKRRATDKITRILYFKIKNVDILYDVMSMLENLDGVYSLKKI